MPIWDKSVADMHYLFKISGLVALILSVLQIDSFADNVSEIINMLLDWLPPLIPRSGLLRSCTGSEHSTFVDKKRCKAFCS